MAARKGFRKSKGGDYRATFFNRSASVDQACGSDEWFWVGLWAGVEYRDDRFYGSRGDCEAAATDWLREPNSYAARRVA